MYENRIQAMTFNRVDPDAVVMWDPERGNVTELEDLRTSKYLLRRTDMGMVNFWDAEGNCSKQECVYFTTAGIEWNGLRQYFTAGQIAELEGYHQRLTELVKIHPEFGVYFSDYRYR